jgi:hypothetical protein
MNVTVYMLTTQIIKPGPHKRADAFQFTTYWGRSILKSSAVAIFKYDTFSLNDGPPFV